MNGGAGEDMDGDTLRSQSMSYKTILVHLNNERRAEALLAPAIQLATRYNSHLLGLHVYAGLPAPPVAMAYMTSVPGSVVAQERKHGGETAATFARLTANAHFVAEWHEFKVPHVDLASVVMEHGRAADLIIASQTDPDWELSPLLDFPERLALESGRPVLVVPYVGRYPRIARNIVIAWKTARESARAVFDAIPLLQGAENVHILEIVDRGDQSTLTEGTSIAASLARHGIKPTIRTSVAPAISVGDEILSRLSDLDADMLVMGAYGHSRLRELVFGGATRHIFRHMTVPTLFTH
jgi:nucleotide-binding universal stress UspA family protein